MGLTEIDVVEPSATRRGAIESLGARTLDPTKVDVAELIADIRRAGVRIPALMMSAYTDERTIDASQAAGAWLFLPKPVPLGALMEKGLQVRTGQTHVQRYSADLLRRIEADEIDTTFLISHRLSLEDAAEGYKNFKDNQNEWTKVVLRPH